MEENKSFNKKLNIVFGVALGIFLAGTITFGALYGAEKARSSTPSTPAPVTTAKGLLSGCAHDSSLVGDGAYVSIDGTEYYFDPDNGHALCCNYILQGGETVVVKPKINAAINVMKYELPLYTATQIHYVAEGEASYTFTTEANCNYVITISFGAM